MNKYKSLAMSKGFSMLLINQYRNTIDMRKGTILKEYGAKNVKYNSDTILRVGPIKSNSIYYDFKKMAKPIEDGIELCFETIKSNKSSPNTCIPFYLCYGRGISDIISYLYALLKLGIIKQSASFYEMEYKGQLIKSQGIKGFYNCLISLPIDFEEFISDIESFYKKC